MLPIYGHSQSIEQCVRAPLHSYLRYKYRYPRRRAVMQRVCTYRQPLSLSADILNRNYNLLTAISNGHSQMSES